MIRRIVWTERALKDLRQLDRQIAQRAGRAIERFAETGFGDVRKLSGTDEWRLRVGDWRIRFLLEDETQTVRVLRILPRGRAYRD